MFWCLRYYGGAGSGKMMGFSEKITLASLLCSSLYYFGHRELEDVAENDGTNRYELCIVEVEGNL